MNLITMERSQLSSYGHAAVFYNKITLAEPGETSDAYTIPAVELLAVGFNVTPNGLIEFAMASHEAIAADTADWFPALQNSPVNFAVTAWRAVRSKGVDNTGSIIAAVTVKGVYE